MPPLREQNDNSNTQQGEQRYHKERYNPEHLHNIFHLLDTVVIYKATVRHNNETIVNFESTSNCQ